MREDPPSHYYGPRSGNIQYQYEIVKLIPGENIPEVVLIDLRENGYRLIDTIALPLLAYLVFERKVKV